ncbi:DNA-binding NarL/FixJ family response regulator [Duganella sp. 1224]|uniref:response regulator n=1 Tax=Duganella sp. 1224 TaxID=2587052 RepID=UPI0015CE9DEE|nr:response regulator transcription factor [Duganella sp. 1224]NYE62779.1 DNA-binding NarL/FixJ family response regulator [Duganella sp. 1224]
MDLSLVRVMIADDHPMMRDGIANTLLAHGAFDIVGSAADGEQALALYQRLRPDVALIDLQMPVMDGLEAIRAIRAHDPDARLIVLSTYCGDARIAAALKAGARTYLMKNVHGAELAATVREVHEGWHVLPSTVRQEIAAQYTGNTPSSRELAVLRLASAGKSNREIASSLVISEATVKAHMSTLLMKLGAADRAHAVALATKRGFIEL